MVVVGAGAFGGWTAWELRRRGASVTVVDAWGPANARASSGGETRVIRATYGTRTRYTALSLRAMELWGERERAWRRTFLHRTGVLWMLGPQPDAQAFGRASADALSDYGSAIEEIAARQAAARYPQIDFSGIASVLFEPDAGYLMARRACEHVIERLVEDGGDYRLGAATAPVAVGDGPLKRLALADGTELAADVFVFACGPWLGTLFPDVVGPLVSATRQEVYYFGPPAGDPSFTDRALPVWIDFRDAQIYGIPGNANRGFKVADDASGPAMDPTTGERETSPEGLAAARRFLSQRFPALAHAPLVGSEVCQYESSPDADFIIDRHPRADDVWIAGGGSGHGFKMGPAVAELTASLVLGEGVVDPQFGLARFATAAPLRTSGRWR